MKLFLGIVFLVILGILFIKVGFYIVQPIGSIPKGVTLLIWRADGEPMFNSPDAVCLKI